MKLLPLVLAVTAVFAFVGGLGGYTFFLAKGHSYLSDDPQACVNCHVMRDQYESWQHSSHRNWANCNSCHMPHDFVGKWTTKAINGWHHSVKFTTGRFPDPIFINDANRRIALDNCQYCHTSISEQMNLEMHEPGATNCISCHGNVGHRANK